eukprot:313335_1
MSKKRSLEETCDQEDEKDIGHGSPANKKRKIMNNDISSNTDISFPVVLEGIKNLMPITMKFNPNTTIDEMTQKLNNILQIKNALKFTNDFSYKKLPKTFKIQIG